MASDHIARARQRTRAKLDAEKDGRRKAPPAARNGTPRRVPDPEPPGTLLSDVRPERVSWLWQARIPRGKLTILDGDPGLGKSVLTIDLAARMSRGLPMPFVERQPGEDSEPAGVVLLNAEDGLADTVLPRLLAAGGDPSRVLALSAIRCGKAQRVLP